MGEKLEQGADVDSTRFTSRPLPLALDTALRERLVAAHAQSPFSPLDARKAARRAARIAGQVGLSATVFRGGLDLRGVEVDHVWLAAVFPPGRVADLQGDGPFVLDAAFPLFSSDFVAALRRYVAGDGTREDLAGAAEDSPVDERVLGVFPSPMRYLGVPVWTER